MKVREILQQYRDQCDLRDLQILIAEVMRVPLSRILLSSDDDILSEDEFEKLKSFIDRNKHGEPISKILNRREFWKDVFFVNEKVLDPRPETEIIIETALKFFKEKTHFNFLDIGTGSGCIPLSLSREFPNAHGIGIDISHDAIEVANTNKERLNIKNVDFINVGWNDFCSALKFDLIVSNPPYIKTEDIAQLDINVQKFDPLLALDGGDSGLNAYEELAPIIKKFLSREGIVLLEIGQDQHQQVCDIFSNGGYQIIEMIPDLQGIIRVIAIAN